MDPQALGRFLRQTREAKELTLDEAETALRIRRRILEAFEVGEFHLPEFAPIQIRGFVRNYARFLGLDEDRVLTFYEEALVEEAKGGRRKKKRKPASSGKVRYSPFATAGMEMRIPESSPVMYPPRMPARRLPSRPRSNA